MLPPKLSSMCTPCPRSRSSTGVLFQSGSVNFSLGLLSAAADSKQLQAMANVLASFFMLRFPDAQPTVSNGTAARCRPYAAGSAPPSLGFCNADVVRPACRQCSNPNTATPVVVPTNTLPSAIVGAMNLLPVPKWSRPLAAWLLL